MSSSSFQNLTKEQADYCLSHMKPYLDSKGRELPSAFDFVEFTRSLFVNWSLAHQWPIGMRFPTHTLPHEHMAETAWLWH